MTKLLPVNLPSVNFYNGMKINESDLEAEQSRNVGIDAANINNFFGSGVLDENPLPPTIFDTANMNTEQESFFQQHTFDGRNIYTGTNISAVSDEIEGVNLAIQLSDIRLDGAASSKVLIIGDTFGGDLVYDDLTFNNNGTKITRNRYKNIRAILFNDFAGSKTGSLNYAANDGTDGYEFTGQCIIREAASMEVSADSHIAYQTAQPNQFFKDFKPYTSTITLTELLQDAIGPDKGLDGQFMAGIEEQ